MKLIHYYPRELFHFYASLEIDKTAVIVERIKQPPRGYTYLEIKDDMVAFMSNTPATMDIWSTKLPFSIGATVEMSSFWNTSEYYLFPITIQNSAIGILFEVTGTRVCQVEKVDGDTQRMMGFEPYSSDPGKQFHFWFIGRYSQMDWDNNVWMQIAEIERTESAI